MSPIRNSRPLAKALTSATNSTTGAASLSSPTPVASESKATAASSKPSAPLKQSTLSFAAPGSSKLVVNKKPSALVNAPAPPPPSGPVTAELQAKFQRLFPSLPIESLSLLELELRTMGEDWLEELRHEMVKPGFLELKRFLLKEFASAKVYPPQEDIYSFTRLSKLSSVRLVIIGQDPYHQPGQAHGLAFSVRKGVRVPPSLVNIYKEIKEEYPEFVIPKHGDLTALAKQGVLLLNTALTVRANAAASHSKAGWEPFTRSIISHLAHKSESGLGSDQGKVFMCWGKHAEMMAKSAGVDEKRNLVLKSVHPSPLSAHRGFFGTGHFKQADEWLKKQWGEEWGVDWTKIGGE